MSRNNGPETGRDQAGRFTAGNPGRPRGARHKATLAAMALLDGEAEALTRAAIEQALAGDTVALRLCLERVAPARKAAPVEFELPELREAGDAVAAAAAIVAAVAAGELAPSEGAHCMALVDGWRRTLETTELETRLAALEKRAGLGP